MKKVSINKNTYYLKDLVFKNEKQYLKDVESFVTIQSVVQMETYPNEKYGLTKEDIEKDKTGEKSLNENWIKIASKWGKEFKGLFLYNENKKLIAIVSAYKNIFTYTNPNKEIQKVWLGNIFVLSEYQGKGIGKYLMNEIITWSNGLETGLDVIEYNTKAIQFYESFGFKYSHKQEDTEYNGKKIPEICMWRKKDYSNVERNFNI